MYGVLKSREVIVVPYIENEYVSSELYRTLRHRFDCEQWCHIKGSEWQPELNVQATLFQVFGNNRVEKAVRKLKITKHLNLISERELYRLFAKLALVKLEDLEQLYSEIKNADIEDNIRGISCDMQKNKFWQSLKPGGVLTDFTSLDKGQIDTLMNVLLPFKQLGHIFLNDTPKVTVEAPDSGQSETEKIELAFILNKLRFTHDLDAKERQLYYAKRITDREPQNDIIIPHERGYYFVHDHISQGSVYATLLKPITPLIDNFIPMVLYRGTRVNFSATRPVATVKAVAYPDQADYTFNEFIPKLNKYLNPQQGLEPGANKRRKQGFMQIGEPFVVGGMSLGGGHAALTAVHYPQRVPYVELTAPIGLLNRHLRKYASCMETFSEQANFKPPEIIRIIDEKDTVTHLGNGHIGYQCLDKVKYSLHCAVSDSTFNEYKYNQRDFWQCHFDNTLCGTPEFLLNTRVGGWISLLQGLCGEHTKISDAVPKFISIYSNVNGKPSLTDEHLSHSNNPRAYVELGRRASAQILLGGLSAILSLICLISSITLVTLFVVGAIALLMSPVGVGLIITVGVSLLLAVTTAAVSAFANPSSDTAVPDNQSIDSEDAYSDLDSGQGNEESDRSPMRLF